jgi:hypothetical protein
MITVDHFDALMLPRRCAVPRKVSALRQGGGSRDTRRLFRPTVTNDASRCGHARRGSHETRWDGCRRVPLAAQKTRCSIVFVSHLIEDGLYDAMNRQADPADGFPNPTPKCRAPPRLT